MRSATWYSGGPPWRSVRMGPWWSIPKTTRSPRQTSKKPSTATWRFLVKPTPCTTVPLLGNSWNPSSLPRRSWRRWASSLMRCRKAGGPGFTSRTRRVGTRSSRASIACFPSKAAPPGRVHEFVAETPTDRQGGAGGSGRQSGCTHRAVQTRRSEEGRLPRVRGRDGRGQEVPRMRLHQGAEDGREETDRRRADREARNRPQGSPGRGDESRSRVEGSARRGVHPEGAGRQGSAAGQDGGRTRNGCLSPQDRRVETPASQGGRLRLDAEEAPQIRPGGSRGRVRDHREVREGAPGLGHLLRARLSR